MIPVIDSINPNLYRVTFGERKQESVIVDIDYDAGNEWEDVRYEAGKVVFDNIFSIDEPVFEEYDIVRATGGETIVRHTVDGIKATAVGGENQFIRKAQHANVEIHYNDDLLFGLGSHEEGYPCLNGHIFPMIQENMRIAVPFFISNKGYAVLIDNTSYMSFDFTSDKCCKIYIDCADCVDFYILTGSIYEIYENYSYLTGETPMLPKWACGYIQSKEHYDNQQELIDVVNEYRKRRVPLDAVVQDWFYWNENMWGEKILDLKRYPDFKKCIDEIHDQNAHLMISIWPNMSGGGKNQMEFKDNNLLLGDGSVYDAFSKEGRDLYWKQAKEGLFQYGVDAWWCDSSEPYDANWGGDNRRPYEEGIARSVAEFKKYIDDSMVNAYSLYHSKGIYENQRKESNKRVMNLTRSGYAGQHRYATVTWSGDVSAFWETLEKQVHILQNYVSSGEAYWNSDIGGFFVKKGQPWFWNGKFDKGVDDPEYCELYIRWLQFAVFTPMMRSHGTDTPREIWRFGSEGDAFYDAIRKNIELRYKLMPFLYSVNAKVTLNGQMPVMPLALAFPDDEAAASVFDEYMYGDTFLVCPVVKPHIKSMEIYLPAGIWYDYHTKEKIVGGRKINVPVVLGYIPVYVRAGAVIPTAPVMQYADEIKDCIYSIEIYEGASGSFALYNDAGDGYEYEQGEYSLIEISYDDEANTVDVMEYGKAEYAHKMQLVRIV